MPIMHEQLSINVSRPVIARKFDYSQFTYPWHFHDEFEIIYTKEGHGERYVADHMEKFSSGDLILVGPNVPHYMKSAPDYHDSSPLRIKGVVIQFEREFMSHAINNYIELTSIKMLLNRSQRGLHFPCPDNQKLTKQIEKLPSHKSVGRITNLLTLLDNMASFKAARTLGSPHYSNSISAYTDNRLSKVLSYLSLNYTKPVGLEEMASRVAMNPSAFSRFFKEKAGKTFMDYIIDMRIGYACKLLSGNTMNISEICMECGFNTVSYFNKIFKRNTGFTPSEYKIQFLNSIS
jgi:AraC-like DNA-binding protein